MQSWACGNLFSFATVTTRQRNIASVQETKKQKMLMSQCLNGVATTNEDKMP